MRDTKIVSFSVAIFHGPPVYLTELVPERTSVKEMIMRDFLPTSVPSELFPTPIRLKEDAIYICIYIHISRAINVLKIVRRLESLLQPGGESEILRSFRAPNKSKSIARI